jgi:2-methylcitrate dehydratase PrpD
MLMTTSPPDGSVPPGQLLKASLPAAMLGLLLAVALKFTTLSPGVATGMSIATFFIAQAILLQRTTGQRTSSKGWATVLLLALATAVAAGLIMEL